VGTRADFYVGRGKAARWLGSIGYDGYPGGFDLNRPDHIIKPDEVRIFKVAVQEEFEAMINEMLEQNEYATLPKDGWPWPWETSSTTDYAYAFDEGKVWASCFGSAWFDPSIPNYEVPENGRAEFPDMTEIQKVTFEPRSGVLVFSVR